MENVKLEGVAKASHVEDNLFSFEKAKAYAKSWNYPLVGETARYRAKRRDARFKPSGAKAR